MPTWRTRAAMVMMRALLLIIVSGLVVADALELAVVRPFASKDEAKQFKSSFATWNDHPPCDEAPAVAVDLFLVYSRDLSADAEAAASVGEVVAGFEEGNQSWHSCFRNLHVLSINLTAEEDVYDPRGAEHNPNWVNGPNSVFRFILNSFVSSNYSSFFLMEIDSIPRQRGWLEQLVVEVEGSSAAISGSRYRGDNWDSFRSKMPDALLLHINGNAIYNVSHPFLAWLNDQLRAEADTDNNRVAYDVRIAEIILEAQAGATQAFADAYAAHVPEGSSVYRPGSKLISNMANTLVNESFDSGSYIMHSSPRNIYPQLNDSRVTLVVSHFDSANWLYFEASVDTYHPFRKISVLASGESAEEERTTVQTPRGPSVVSWNVSQQPQYMSLCEAASLADTEFFAFGDTYHVIASPVSILMDGDAAVLPYLNASSQYCTTDVGCTSSLDQAESLFGVTLGRHYNKYDTLFRTELMQPFCDAWTAAANGRSFETCGVDFGPTADDYIAWIISEQRPLHQYYKQVSREVKGWRSWLLLVTAHPPDPRQCGFYNQDFARWMRGNISGCNKYVETPEECNADRRCMWRPLFQTGKCIPFNAATKTKAAGAKRAAAENTTTTNTTTTTVTTTTSTTTRLVAVIASVLIPINVSRITEELVSELLAELEVAAAAVKDGVSDANYIEAPGVRLELSEKSSILLQAPPTPVQKQIYFDSIRETRCGSMTRDQCDVQEPNSTVGLKATKGATPRRLQNSLGYELAFEVFMIVHEAADMQGTVPLDDASFLNQFVAAVAAGVAAHAELNANETELAQNDTAALTTVDLIGFLTEPTSSALTVVELSAEETAPVDISVVQAEVSDPVRVTQAVSARVGTETLVGVPTVDLCLGRTCGGNGVCQAGVCLCDAGWNPPNCLLPITSTTTTSTPTSTSTTSTTSATETVPPTTVAPVISADESNTQAALISIAVLAGISTCGLCVLCCRAAVVRIHKRKSAGKGEDNNALDNEENPTFSEGLDLPSPVPEVNEVCVVSIRPSAFQVEEQEQAHRETEPDLATPIAGVRAVSIKPSSFETENQGLVGDVDTDLPADRSIRATLPAVDLEDQEAGASHGAQVAAEDGDFGDSSAVADEAQTGSPRPQEEAVAAPRRSSWGLTTEIIDDEPVVFV